MAALFFPSGPIDLFAKFRDNTTLYIGTCKEAPEVEVRPAYIDIKTDVSGRSVPMQKVYDGEQHLLYLTATNRFDWAGYKRMARARGGALIGLPGATFTDFPTDRGSLSIGVDDFEFVLRYSFGGTAVAPTDMPLGRRYYSCLLLGARESTVGSRIMEVSMVLEANGLYEYSSGSGRRFKLYSEVSTDVTDGLPNVN